MYNKKTKVQLNIILFHNQKFIHIFFFSQLSQLSYFAHFTLNTFWPLEICVPMALHHSYTSTLYNKVKTKFRQWRKEGNVLFNDALNTFYLWLYGVRHMVKYHTDSERGNPPPPHGLLFSISSKGSFYMHHPTDRIAHTTAFVITVVSDSEVRIFCMSIKP